MNFIAGLINIAVAIFLDNVVATCHSIFSHVSIYRNLIISIMQIMVQTIWLSGLFF